jgi:NAD(P)-dependent dehydrogenase (short-subunit alcohol dehydrogenase family)
MKHALVIGGTGMLSDVSLWLVSKGYRVSVVGRSEKRLEQLRSQAKKPTSITPLLADYREEDLLTEQIREAVNEIGPLEMVVAWIHYPFKNVLETITREAENPQQWKLFHVIGSRANASMIHTDLHLAENCKYRQVQLGFVIEGEQSRWLTHEEISNGVIEAILKDKQYHLVGVLEPDSKRPF